MVGLTKKRTEEAQEHHQCGAGCFVPLVVWNLEKSPLGSVLMTLFLFIIWTNVTSREKRSSSISHSFSEHMKW